MQTTTQTTAKKAATVPVTAPAPVAPLTLLATLQAQAPATVTSAQLSALVTQLQGIYAPVQHGIAAPTRGTSCVQVWCAFTQYCITNKTVPTLVQLAPQLTGVNPTTQSVQYYKVRKYFGL